MVKKMHVFLVLELVETSSTTILLLIQTSG